MAFVISTIAFTNISARATLIVTVPTQDGMLIVSDKMRHNSFLGNADDTEKVIRLGTNAAMAITGMVGFTLMHGSEYSAFQSESMVAFDLARAYFATNALKPFDVVRFAHSMSDQYSNHLARYNLHVTNSDFTGCQFIFLRVDAARERHTFVASLIPLRTGKAMGFTVNCQQSVQNDADFAVIGAYGQSELPIEILRGHDPRFAEIRTNSIITKFLPYPPLVKKVKLADAQAFAHFLITQASEQTKLLNPKAAIGTNLDDTILMPAGPNAPTK